MIYLDHNATTPLRASARAAMLATLSDGVGNPSSAHAAGRAARSALERARRSLAEALGVAPAAVCFTSGATEANNLAVLGALPEAVGRHVVATPIEHASVLGPLRELERRGAAVTWLPVDGTGRVAVADVVAALVAGDGVGHRRVGERRSRHGAAHRRDRGRVPGAGVPLHVDAAQAVGRIAVDLAAVDLCTSPRTSSVGRSGSAPSSCGAAWGCSRSPGAAGRSAACAPAPENVAAAVGFAAAVAEAVPGAGIAALRDRLWDALAALGDVGRYGAPDGLANTLTVGFRGLTGEAVVAALDLEGVAVSVGSACAAGAGEPSHVLRAIGCDEQAARAGVRFSLGEATTAADIEVAAVAVRRVVARMRGVDARLAVAG
ncbi:MAG: aminotransferase class V-fold PLP-dependent enzyme [Candidatus Binatia bacterium]